MKISTLLRVRLSVPGFLSTWMMALLNKRLGHQHIPQVATVRVNRPLKRVIGVLSALILGTTIANAQQNVFSRDNSGTGDWGSGNLPWFYQSSNNSQGDPDNGGGTRNDVFIGHNNNTSMTLNGRFYLHRDFTFQAGASNARTLGFSGSGGFSFSRLIDNASTATHVFNTPVGIDGGGAEIRLSNGSGGNLTFNGSIFTNNNQTFIRYSSGNTGTITFNGAMTQGGSFVKQNGGTLVFTGSADFSGSIFIDEGTVRINRALSSNAIEIGGNVAGSTGLNATLEISSNVTVSKGITVRNFNNAGGNRTLNFTHTTGTATASGAMALERVLTVDNGSGNSGATLSGVLSGAGGITKTGTGILTISNANTYTGGTTINGGTLTLGAANALPVTASAGLIRFGSGTPTLNLGLFNLGSSTASANSAGALDFDVNTTINLGSSGTNTYYFKASNGQTWGATTITINNWTGTAGVSGTGRKIFIGSDINGLTSAQLAKITFGGFSAGAVILSTGEVVPAPPIYRSIASGNWNSTSTWQSSSDNGATWAAAVSTPSSTQATTVTIRNGHTVSQNQNYTAGNANIIVVESGGILNMTGASGNFQFNSMTVSGTVVRNNTTNTYVGTTFTVNNGGRYVHEVDGGSIPTITWNAGSTFEVTGITGATLFTIGGAQAFHHVLWNCTGQSSIFIWGLVTTVNGNFTVQSTGASPSPTSMLVLTNTTPLTTTISGNLSISGGYFAPFGLGTTGNSTMNITGNLSVSGGTFDIFRPASNTGTINLNGDFTLSAGTITKGGAGTGNFNFNRAGTQNFSKTGGTISNAINFTVLSGSTLAMGTNVLDGSSGTFNLNSGAGIITANAGGLSSSGATGAIQVTGTRTFSTGANYTFNGTAAQVTGTGFTGGGTVTLNNTAGISLSGNATIGTLNLTNGVFTVGAANTVTINGGGSVAATSGSLASGTAAGRFVFAGAGTITGTLGFHNVEAAGGVNFGTASTVNGMFTINTGGFVDGGNPPTYATGSTLRYSVNAAYGRFNEWNATSGRGYPHHVIVTNNTTLNVNNGTNVARQIAGDLTIDAGSTFSMEGMSIANPTVIGVTVLGNIINNGTVTLSTATERLQCANYTNNTGATTSLSSIGGGDLEVTGNLIDNATFNANTRAVFFTGTGTQDVSGTGTFNIDYLVSIKSGGEIRMLNNLVCAGPNGGNAIVLSSATDILNLNGFALTIGQTSITSGISGSGFIRGGGNSTINIVGSGSFGSIRLDQSTDGTTNLLKDLTINRASSGTITIENNIYIKETLGLTAGTLNLNNGDITLISDATGTARVPSVGGTITYSGTGRFVHQRHIPAPARRAWRLLTAPLSNTNSIRDSWQNGGTFTANVGTHITGPGGVGNGFDPSATNATSFRMWLNTQSFANVSSTITTNISQGGGSSAANTGYYIFVRGDRTPSFVDFGSVGTSVTTLSARGRLQTGDQTFTSIATTENQFTLIGNPYASPIDWNLVLANAGNNRIQRKIYTWDSRLNNVGGYVVLDDADSPGTFEADPVTTEQDQIIQSGQAFFIVTDAGSGSPTLVFQENDKATDVGQGFLRPASPLSTIPLFRANLFLLNTSDNSIQIADGATARFGTTFCNCVDNLDNIKLTNTNETFGFVRNGTFLATERRAGIMTAATDTLQVRLTRSSERAYQLQLIGQNLPGGVVAKLLDSYTGLETPLSISDTNRINFVINADAASKNQDRFRVVFGPLGGPLPVTFTNLSARQQNRDIAVTWSVENQVNIRSYQLERAADGRNFSQVHQTAAVGANGTSNTYSFLDLNPTNGDHFYRVRSIGVDGQQQLSRVVKVTIGTGKTGITVYPNPVRDGVVGVQLNNLPAGTYQVRLMNMSGQQVLNQVLNHDGGSATEQLRPASVMAKGIYQLEILATNGGQRLTSQVIVE